jgi:hypothetical protein
MFLPMFHVACRQPIEIKRGLLAGWPGNRVAAKNGYIHFLPLCGRFHGELIPAARAFRSTG